MYVFVYIRLSLVVNVAKTRKKLPLSVASRRKEMISLGFLYLSYRQHNRLDVRVCVCTQLIAHIYRFVFVCVKAYGSRAHKKLMI